MAIGKNDAGDCLVIDLAPLPHLLVTGSNVTAFLHTAVMSLLFRLSPNACRLVFIGHNVVELNELDQIPHALDPVINDPRQGISALEWAVSEMEKRQNLLESTHVRTLNSFNEKVTKAGRRPLPQIVIVIGDLARLMAFSTKECELAIVQLAQTAHAVGIHLIVGSHDDSKDHITNVIEANLTNQISLRKRTNDTLPDLHYKSNGKEQRLHSVFATAEEVREIAHYWCGQPYADPYGALQEWLEGIHEAPSSSESLSDEELYRRAVSWVIKNQRASISGLQRELRIGYNQASRLIERMEATGVVSQPSALIQSEALAEVGLRHAKSYGFIDEAGFRTNNEVLFEHRSFSTPENRKNFQFRRDIGRKPNSDEQEEIEGAIKAALEQHFLDVGISKDEQERLIAKVAKAILQRESMPSGRWSKAILAENTSLSGRVVHKDPSNSDATLEQNPAPERHQIELPSSAPAIWKDSKLAGDTPSDFIKRHYGPWLKSDATGLTRPDIKRFDPSLYMALANWLRKNELPDDCPVPIKSERVNAELDRFLEGGIGAIVTGPSDPEHVLREARRMASATQRRR